MASRRQGRENRSARNLPSFAEITDFLRSNPDSLGAREIARAFGLGPSELPGLRGMLRAIERSGELVRTGNRKFAPGRQLPDLLTVERFASDADGFPLVRPVADPDAGAGADSPGFRLIGDAADELSVGERALVRLLRRDSGAIEAEIVRRLEPTRKRLVGVFRRTLDGGFVVPIDRRDRGEYRVLGHDAAGLPDDELVAAEEAPARRGQSRARILERLGPASGAGAISRMMIAEFEIPAEFPPAALAEVAAMPPFRLDGRADLRELALVTIDDTDARDFDDAVWAEPDPDPANPGGWHIVVAIADVAAYVRAGGPLDREAERRGNSVYFPDRVVPMLPEALSNNLCSLRPGEDRPCLAAHLWIDGQGRKRRHRFERAVMRSAARLTYDAVQRARDGIGRQDFPLAPERLDALYGAFTALTRARDSRGALDLDLAEYRVLLDEQRRPTAVVLRQRHDSHRLIEEFMILANIAAAEELEQRGRACMYRVHDAPDPEKLAALRAFLESLNMPGLALAKGQVIRPALFNRILQRAAGTPHAEAINEMVLRSQAQAAYSPANIGHFGLALPRYAHFTSPIRRYADLLVHRALLGEGPPAREGEASLRAIGEHISATERHAAAAERATIERYRTLLLSGAIGTIFDARITGVAPFGLFVRIADSGADGLVPISTLPSDYYDYDSAGQRLLGRRFGRAFTLGLVTKVTLVEADTVGGRLLFRIDEDAPATGRPPPRRAARPPYRRRR